MASEKSTRMDWLYSGVALLLIGCMVLANSYWLEIPRLGRIVGFVIVATLVVLLLIKTRWGTRALVHAQDVRQEVARMHWPTRQETVQTTVATLAMVLVMGLLLWTADFILLRAVKWLTGHWGV